MNKKKRVKKWKIRLMSMFLVCTLVLGSAPMECHAETSTDEYSVYDVVEKVTVREKEYKKSKTLYTAKKGALLISLGCVKNKHGNVWMKVLDLTSNKIGYVHVTENIQEHQHEYTQVDNSPLLYCRCGELFEKKEGVTETAGAVAALPPVISPDIAAALGSAGATIGSAVGAALPYVAVAVVAGVTLFISLKLVDRYITVDNVTTDFQRVDESFKPKENEYYVGIVKGDYFFIDVANPMEINKAMKYMDVAISAHKLNDSLSWFVYTLHDYSALSLAENYAETRSGVQMVHGDDTHTSGCPMRQFKHIHIASLFNPFNPFNRPDVEDRFDNWMDHLGGHIAYGTPMLDTMWGQGAWF